MQGWPIWDSKGSASTFVALEKELSLPIWVDDIDSEHFSCYYLNCLMIFTGYEDAQNKFHNLFKCFSAASISRALTMLNPILPTTSEWELKRATFNRKRETLAAISTSTKPTPPSKGINFSDDEDSPPSLKRQKLSSPPKEPAPVLLQRQRQEPALAPEPAPILLQSPKNAAPKSKPSQKAPATRSHSATHATRSQTKTKKK